MSETRAMQLIQLAAEHADSASMASSAHLCLDDARSLMARGDYQNAKRRATDSLRYSLGILHPDFPRDI
jgi:hypothetical protein